MTAPWFVAIVFLFGLRLPCIAQKVESTGENEARNLVAQAQQHIAGGEWDTASSELDKAKESCRATPSIVIAGCLPLVNFAEGYLWQQRSATLAREERQIA